MIQNSIKAFKAEWLKLKGSGMFWILLPMSLITPLIITLATIFGGTEFHDVSENQWKSFIDNCYTSFAGFFYPIFLILIVVRLCQVEHRNGGWKLIETQPIHRLHLFIAKFKTAILLSLLCLLCLLVFALLGATIYSFTKGGNLLQKQTIPIVKILAFVVRLWIAGFGLMALQYALSIWIPNFALPFIVGFVMIIAASIMSAFDVANWLPYSAPSLTVKGINGSIINDWLLHHERLSIAWMFLFLWIGYQYFYFKGWANAFFKPFNKIIKLVVAITIFAMAFWWIEKPVQSKPYHTTVVAGVINTTDTIKGSFVLLKLPDLDTVLTAPIFNKKYHVTFQGKLPLGEYVVGVGKYKFKVIFGSNDSLYCKWTISKTKNSIEFSGTRAAENELYKSMIGKENFDYDDYYLKQNMKDFKPDEFANKIAEQIEKLNKKIDKFKTSDNIKPAQDFVAILKKLKSIEYLNLLQNKYPRTFKLYHPNQKLVYPKEADTLQKIITMSDSSLLKFDIYKTYLSQSFRHQAGVRPTSFDTTFFNYVIAFAKSEAIKNTVLNAEITEAISFIKDSSYRNYLAEKYIPQISDEKLRTKLYNKNKLQNSFQRGKPAPFFVAENLLGELTTLMNFKGRFIAIDVWATWCGPCLEQSPYFDELAEKYTDEMLAFVSISVDEEKNDWKRDASDKSKNVLQLWAINKDIFMNAYGIDGIPRFMLIDPNGKIVNINMARPSEQEFEAILQREVFKTK